MSGEATAGASESLLRSYREMAHLTQEELAERAGVSVRSISNIERGMAHTPHLDTVRRLAEALQLTEEQQQHLHNTARPGSTSLSHEHAAPPPVSHSSITPLPVPVTPLIGREQETTALADLLTQRSSRLLTITGAGGVGKTRLALHVAGMVHASFADGVAFVSLAPLHDPGPLLAVIAHALGVREDGDQSTQTLLHTYLRDHEVLLVVDNCEHLLPALAALLADLVAISARLTLLATSRVALHVRGELVYALSPLHLPAADETAFAAIAASPAIQLFVDRVRALDTATPFALTPTNAPTVAAICQRLDGLPLAIELAAARSALFSPHMLLERLDTRLGFLTTGAYDLPQRQQTLRNTLAWSYDLLPPATQQVFRQLAVFAGGWTLDAANQVCYACQQDGIATDETEEAILDSLATLVEHHMVRQVPHDDERNEGALRFHMLETVREYAWECLRAGGEEDDAIERHSRYYVTLAETAEPQLSGPEQISWSTRLEHEQANLRLAIRRSLDTGSIIVALRLVTALATFWLRRGYLSEGRAWLDEALAHIHRHRAPHGQTLDGQSVQTAPAPTPVMEFLSQEARPDWLPWYAKTLARTAKIAAMQNDFALATTGYDHSLTLLRALGDTREAAGVLNNLGECLRVQEKYAQALPYYEESLALKIANDDLHGIANSLNNIGLIQTALGTYDIAESTLLDCLARVRALQDPLRIARTLANLGVVAIRRQQYHQAQQLLEESLVLWRTLDDPISLAYALGNLGDVYDGLGDYPQALALSRQALQLYHQAGIRSAMADALLHIAHVLCAQEHFRAAVRLLGAAAAVREEIGITTSPFEDEDLRADRSRASLKLGTEAYRKAWDEGRLLTLDEAVAEAHEDTEVTGDRCETSKLTTGVAGVWVSGRPYQTLPSPLAQRWYVHTLPPMA